MDSLDHICVFDPVVCRQTLLARSLRCVQAFDGFACFWSAVTGLGANFLLSFMGIAAMFLWCAWEKVN